jgi:hypothetical protein
MKKNCPVAKKLRKQIFKLIRTVKKTRKVMDMPKKEDVEAWINKNEFQPWE